jgi:prepilin-type N-terminal cleavage/methylation domain-containing protein
VNIRRKDKGFTIIEVVLVLAIAALIFLMVFIALPGLQRAQKDQQRKSDLSRATVALATYASNNRNSIPANTNAAWSSFVSQYLTPTASDTFIDPLGAAPGSNATTYVMTANNNVESPVTGDSNNFNNSTKNVIYFSEGYTCGTGGAIEAAGNRTVALRMYLEGGGIACQNN